MRRKRMAAMACMVVCMMLAVVGCSPRVVPAVQSAHDTVYIAHATHDSIVMRDSITLIEYQRGDTVYVNTTRWREHYVDRWRTDTVYKSRVDTLTTKVTEYRQTQWQRTTSVFGYIYLVLMALAIVYGIAKCKPRKL